MRFILVQLRLSYCAVLQPRQRDTLDQRARSFECPTHCYERRRAPAQHNCASTIVAATRAGDASTVR